MAISKALYSKASDEWETPQWLFDQLDKEFHFTLDAAATSENAKCRRYYTKEDNGLAQSWTGEVVWLNPPYSQVAAWIRKAWAEGAHYGGAIVVCLVPSRTDTRWWHDYVIPYASEIRFVRGRLRFGESSNSAPFPSAIIVFGRRLVLGRRLVHGLNVSAISREGANDRTNHPHSAC